VQCDIVPKIILITGATDGIGLETAKMLSGLGHTVLMHGRSADKLADVEEMLRAQPGAGHVETYVADFSSMADVEALASDAVAAHPTVDILINNAGIYGTPNTRTADGLDTRFAVNTIAPYVLTRLLLPQMAKSGRVINLSSAAQAPVDLRALSGKMPLSDGAAYAQSKLALTMWSRVLAESLKGEGPAVIAINPGSLLATKMVMDAYGSARAGVDVGAQIVTQAALSDAFQDASGQYFDNDEGRFAAPHPDALHPTKAKQVVAAIEDVLARITPSSGRG
jgi:NAD(P)-dependent dehydrogenase (short-subunit alcohol dehydrogenase family)